ncbi:MAG: hypothetical protein JWO78_939 [Micavibrio sp.]|nr:hypothetical protein [Micavibrio sp.]
MPVFWQKDAEYVPELDCYTIGWGSDNLIGKAMVEEAKEITEAKAEGLARALKCPGQVILAENSDISRKSLFNSLKDPKEFHVIAGADHCFNRGDVVNNLLDRTYMWFERF